jgi:hypothetical protein
LSTADHSAAAFEGWTRTGTPLACAVAAIAWIVSADSATNGGRHVLA